MSLPKFKLLKLKKPKPPKLTNDWGKRENFDTQLTHYFFSSLFLTQLIRPERYSMTITGQRDFASFNGTTSIVSHPFLLRKR